MDYTKINEMLKDLRGLRQQRNLVERTVVKELNGEGSQGEENEIYEIYKTDIEGIFIKLRIASNSYGDDEFIDAIQFVSPKQKTITNYEPLN